MCNRFPRIGHIIIIIIINNNNNQMMIPKLSGLSQEHLIQSSKMSAQMQQAHISLNKLKSQLTIPQPAFLHNNVLDKLNSLSIITNKPLVFYRKQQITRFSLIPSMRISLLQNIHSLAQIEFEYDPFEKSLYKLPSGRKATQVLNDVFQKTHFSDVFDMISQSQFKNNIFKKQVVDLLIEPIIRHVFRCLKQLYFSVSQDKMSELLWNYDIETIILTQKQFSDRQTQNITSALKQFHVKSASQQRNILNDFKKIVGDNLISRRRKTNDELLFFGKISDQDYLKQNYPNHIFQTIKSSFQQQIAVIKSKSLIIQEQKINNSAKKAGQSS